MALIAGASSTAVTVSVNVSLDVAAPSLTVTWMVTGPPCRFAAGDTVTVRFAPDPPSTMFWRGTNT